MTEIAYKASRVLVDAESEPLRDAVVVVTDGRITHVAEAGGEIARSGLVDLGGLTLMPGMVDCHVHLAMDPGSGTATTVVANDSASTLSLMRHNARRLLDAGVTTARDLGAPDFLCEALMHEVAEGSVRGPNLQAAHSPITVPGGHAHSMGGEAEGEPEVRAVVRRNVAHGAKVIKVMTTGGFMTAGSQPWEPRFGLDELRAIVDESHELGVLTTTHALGVDGIELAVRAGFDAIEHCGWVTKDGTRFDPKIADAIRRAGTFVDPTMNTACLKDNYFCPWDSYANVVGNVRKMHEHGIKLVMGTDAGIGFVHFERYSDGLRVLRDAGMSDREVVAASTSLAAEACGLEGVAGKIAQGYRADMIAVPGNPLDGIEVLSQPRFVTVAGEAYEPRPIPEFVVDPASLGQLQSTLINGSGR